MNEVRCGRFRWIFIASLLLLVFGIGTYLRTLGLDWGEAQFVHPDEAFMSDVTGRVRIPSSLSEYFDTINSPLNPNNAGKDFYVYGDFPILLVRYAVDVTGYPPVYLVGRYIAACLDSLTILFTFLIAQRLFDARVGLLAALLYGASALPIQISHFYTVDPFANFFATAAFYFVVRMSQQRHWLDAPVFGLLLGLGMASKITVVTLLPLFVSALALRIGQEAGLLHNRYLLTTLKLLFAQWRWPVERRGWAQAISHLAIGGLLALLSYRIFQPYAFLPLNVPLASNVQDDNPTITLLNSVGAPVGMALNPKWIAQMNEASVEGSGSWDAPPNHQWASRTHWLFPLINMVSVGLGWPLGFCAWFSVLWSIWEIFREHAGSARLILPLAWVLLVFGWQGSRWVMTMRYFLPIYPQLAILSGWALITAWDRIQALIQARAASRFHPAAFVSLGIATIVGSGSLLWAIAVSGIYTRPITRLAASHWIAQNIPSDVTFRVQTDKGEQLFQVGLPNDWVPPDQPYDPIGYTLVPGGIASNFQFIVPFGGTLNGVSFNYIADLQRQETPRELHISLRDAGERGGLLAEGIITADFYAGGEPRGRSYNLEFDPVNLVPGRAYQLVIEPDARGGLVFAGSTLAHEGDWDWPVPINIPPYDMWGVQYQGYQLQVIWEDTPAKLERMLYILDHSDYLTIASNRFYDSLSRNPERWPMTIAYYRALFNGELGFKLVAEFSSRPSIGPIVFCDDHAEEAWTVYDHPRVLIFQKTDDFSSERVRQILMGVDLSLVRRVSAQEVKQQPIILQAPLSCSLLEWLNH